MNLRRVFSDSQSSIPPSDPPPYAGEAVSFVARNKGTHSEPDVVEAFLKIHEEFRKIASDLPGLVK
jgi:response regulator RpfG family c-di-GMP phosphodiesterase